MTTRHSGDDYLTRQAAIDPARSFIVQAPAGSGKTELLTQRYLVLLTHVQHNPEEIIAITFTRKAAAEMQARIINALQLAAANHIPGTEHEKYTIELAQNVLQRDKKENWHLINNPQRLRIQTIDSLCLQLVKQMPILSQFGTPPNITDNARPLYVQAVREVIASLEDKESWSPALEQLLLHLDNQQQKLEDLLVDLLARRDQWLPHLIYTDHNQLIIALEEALQRIIIESLEKLQFTFPEHLINEWLTISRFAANNLKSHLPDSAIIYCLELNNLPSCGLSTRQEWLGLSHLLLTKEQEWRKKFTINEGFPPATQAKNKEEKAYYEDFKKRILQLVELLKGIPNLLEVFRDFISAPPHLYVDSQKNIIIALLTILPVLVAQLRIVFAQHATVDYNEITMRALQALGEAEHPTDLALTLDYKIQHILMDEFQDTSISQFRLLEKLTAGWQPQDGRTLFLVGDPMQSIYRFRKAEVGLFLRAQQQGIGNVILESLQLTANFRANANLVNWTNQLFSNLFPAQSDIGCGAISFSYSIPTKPAIDHAYIEIHLFNNAHRRHEGSSIVDIINKTWSQNPDFSIAILVRSRQHLIDIIPALQFAKIPYRAIEIELLSQHSVIQDLLALTKALLHLGDRTAWLAILRAPWCGLTLADMHAIVNNDFAQSIWEQINQNNNLISVDGKQRLQKLIATLKQSLAERRRKPLSEWIESTWLQLGGPACLNTENDLANADMYFKLLENIANGDDINDFSLLENQLNSLTATASNSDTKLEIMTIHKAKGLEFDSVILPGLDRNIRQDDKPLLAWMERPSKFGENDLIMAPLKSVSDDQDLIYNFIRREENKKSLYETQRLLYVAVTRAKYQLNLIVPYQVDNDANNSILAPRSTSLLAQIWPLISKEIIAQHENSLCNDPMVSMLSNSEEKAEKKQLLKRLSKDWSFEI